MGPLRLARRTASVEDTMLSRLIALAIGSALLIGCGSSGSDAPSFEGRWQVSLQISQDDCGVSSNDTGIIQEEQLISQVDNENWTLNLGSVLSFGPALAGTTIQPTQLNFEQNLEGSIGGAACQLQQSFGYNDLQRSTEGGELANLVFLRSISCADGLTCSTRALGTATKTREG